MKGLVLHFVLCASFVSSISPASASKQESLLEEAEQTSVAPSRRKRSVFHLFNMMTCATDCNPLDYKGYGCYCGFLGSGVVVDGIDKCCKGHDWCYEHASCKGIDHYFTPYKWKCNGGSPYCVPTKGPLGGPNSCGHQLCECDREFVECLKQYPCPRTKAMCMTSPWRYWQNLFMGMSSGMGMHHPPHEEHSEDHPNETF
ncbi:basic phospholipase A2 pseudexin A chain-like isoform X1 [Penaeus japonicus]|uniref:basic phospholipase A2 pseudexin A chain-like isoform X1 n=1 Tax=Penaeus japonicus TaxID=27405 RepID=UPI001C715477|nr:basic phospholipase A2 pseudexin A chain-like isoform X1 [Penaeus japonicus]